MLSTLLTIRKLLKHWSMTRAHRNDRELIRNLIEKARLCKGLTHREAAILLGMC